MLIIFLMWCSGLGYAPTAQVMGNTARARKRISEALTIFGGLPKTWFPVVSGRDFEFSSLADRTDPERQDRTAIGVQWAGGIVPGRNQSAAEIENWRGALGLDAERSRAIVSDQLGADRGCILAVGGRTALALASVVP
jgi:hypothetical protein